MRTPIRKKLSAAPLSKGELIVNAARKLFLEEGFGATSMDAIAHQAGVSKPTLYSHFQNKHSLFSEVMVMLCNETGGPNMIEEIFTSQRPPHLVLIQAGKFLLNRALHPTGIALFRTVLAEAPKFPELGKVFWETGPQRFTERLSQYLASQKRKSRFRIPNPLAAAELFRAMIIGTYVLPALVGVAPTMTDKERDRRITHTVSAFLNSLGSQPL